MKCVFCGKEINDVTSNNAEPYRGKCCSECNSKIVITTRLAYTMSVSMILFDIDKHSVSMLPMTYNIKDILGIENVKHYLHSDNVEYVCTVEFQKAAFYVFHTTDKKMMKSNKMFNQLLGGQCKPLRGPVLIVRQSVFA